MRTRTIRPLLPTALLLALAAVVAASAPPGRAAAQATPEADFMAWDIAADFRGAALAVTLTTYSGTYDPPAILDASTIDITGNCAQRGPGTIAYQGGYADFDGSAFIRCELPPGLISSFGADQCEESAELGYFFFGADVRLDPVSHSNPLLTASDGSFAVSLPGNGVTASTRVRLAGHQYMTQSWQRDAGGNMVLMGQYGPLMVEASEEAEVLSFLPADWQPYFAGVGQDKVGHWMSAASGTQTWGANAAELPYSEPPRYVFIGHNPATKATFRGELAYVEGDPPGCTVK